MSGKPEITKMLTVSTANVSKETWDLLEREADDNALGLSVYPKGEDFEFGCFVYLPPASAKASGMPDDLAALVAKCRRHQCEVLCLDPDGPVDESLGTYDW